MPTSLRSPATVLGPAMLGLAVATPLCAPATADACAILPAESSATPELAVERVLILHDAERRLEHFVREVRFDGAAGTFAFVVPTPAQPEVAVVEKPPFDDLERAFPLDPPAERHAGAKSAGAPPEQAVASVQVLSVQQVGKFTAFVLAASDAIGLETWLTDNRIAVPPGGKDWLQHYIGLKHFFTAFRFDAPKPAAPAGGFATPPSSSSLAPAPSPAAPVPLAPDGSASGEMTSETVRLTFAAATPYFPYLEPAHGAAAGGWTHRLNVWLVSTERRAPRLRRFATAEAPRWAWPWDAGMVYEREAAEVRPVLGELGRLAPQQGALVVQTFHDRRANRDGWGDIVFPAESADLDDPGLVAAFTPVLGDLGKLIHHGPLEPNEVEAEESMRLPPSSGACGCQLPGAGAGGLAAAALAALAIARRRRPSRGPR